MAWQRIPPINDVAEDWSAAWLGTPPSTAATFNTSEQSAWLTAANEYQYLLLMLTAAQTALWTPATPATVNPVGRSIVARLRALGAQLSNP